MSLATTLAFVAGLAARLRPTDPELARQLIDAKLEIAQLRDTITLLRSALAAEIRRRQQDHALNPECTGGGRYQYLRNWDELK